jgi:hypothetical protein
MILDLVDVEIDRARNVRGEIFRGTVAVHRRQVPGAVHDH